MSGPADPPRPVVVAMGVSGSGKTTLGCALARRMGSPFEEGDALHPMSNVEKMRAGVALDDADRAPWLDAVAGWIEMHGRSGGVISCSALKLAYRNRLRRAVAQLRFVLLDANVATLRERVAHRPDHFMPASLLQSQLDTLERPGLSEPDVLTVDGAADEAVALPTVLRWLGLEALDAVCGSPLRDFPVAPVLAVE